MLKGASGETYCVGGDNEQTNLALVELLCDLVDHYLCRPQGTSRKLKTFIQDRAGHDRRYAIDASRIHTKLGWKARVIFAEGLRQTVVWYLGKDHRV